MEGLGAIGSTLFYGSILASPFAILLFRPRVMGGGFFGNLYRMISDYWLHFSLFGVIYWQKNFVDDLNDPLRGIFGDYTWLIYKIEGEFVLWVQDTFYSTALTHVLNFNYLFAYIFMNYFTVILAAYAGDRELANKAALNYVIIYLLSVPFYIFFNVQITSDYIPEMRALLYHSGVGYFSFFTAADPFDNAFPSLHMGIPYGLFLVMYWTMRKRGHTIRTWNYGPYLMFVIAQLFLFGFSILYLGIHWITDIPAGFLIGLLGASIVEEVHERFFESGYGAAERAGGRLRALRRRVFPAASPADEPASGR